MTYGQLEDFRKISHLSFEQMEKILNGIDIRDIESITYDAKANAYKILISKDAQ